MKKPVGLQLDKRVIEYFKRLSLKTGMPYQGLINFCLTECMKSGWSVKSVGLPKGEGEL